MSEDRQAERILFVTGKLARASLERVLAQMAPREFAYEIATLGITVAGLMTTEFIARHLGSAEGFDRVVLPGRCRGELEPLAEQLGAPVQRGPDELKDLPQFFGRRAAERDLGRYELRIFAEIVEAPELDVEQIIARARAYRAHGADVIDLGALPSTPFTHLAEAVAALKSEGFAVSVDSLDSGDLLAGGRAGADYLLSLTEDTLWVAEQVEATPVLIPVTPSDQDSLYRAIDALQAAGRPLLADAILDPIHFGFTESVLRYKALRDRYPEVEIMMGIGNLTELTHADSAGVNTLLCGICSELGVSAVLTTQVSEHCRRAVAEVDRARRIMFAARVDGTPPQHIDSGLMCLHERKPFPDTDAEIGELAAAVRDPNFRIQVSASGISAYNRDGLLRGTDPYEFYPRLQVDDDASHAFYLGMELARAQIAWQLGKRYNQDEELAWGCATDAEAPDLLRFEAPKSTLRARRCRRRRGKDG